MDSIGFDLGKLNSQSCIITKDGELLEGRVKTDRENLTKFFGGRARVRVFAEILPRRTGAMGATDAINAKFRPRR